MKKIFFVFTALLFTLHLSAQYNEQDIKNYINQYKELAIWKMYEYKIPASITLAQGVFESACGTSRLATEGNNHFGIKCHKDWEGDTLKVDDDELQECFRKYATVEESYTDHSLFLTTRARYASLFQLDIMDYKAWANGLKAAGYATNPQYAQRLIDLIERFNIAQWDTVFQQRVANNWFTENKVRKHLEAEQLAQQNTQQIAKTTASTNQKTSEQVEQSNTTEETNSKRFTANAADYQEVEYPFTTTERKVYVNNRVYFVIATENDSYAAIAKEVQDSEKNIKRYNDIKVKQTPIFGEVVYVNPKSKSAAEKTHVVKEGETLQYISQMYGIQLSSIFKYNNLSEKSVIHPEEVIFLKR